MKILKKLMCAAAVAMSMSSAQAAPILNEWVFNPIGGGFDSGQQVHEYLDVNGNAFFDLSSTGGTGYAFTQHAAFNVAMADSNGWLFPISYPGGNITATLEATGTGNFGGAFHFTGGTIKLYQNPTNGQFGSSEGIYGANLGNLIATLALFGGGGEVDADGSPRTNSQFTMFARAGAGALADGYFFGSDGQKLPANIAFSFAYANANTVGLPQTRLVEELACQYAGFTGPGCNGMAFENTPREHFFTSINGQFKLFEVPEPGSLALFGIAMLGAGVAGRKRAVKS